MDRSGDDDQVGFHVDVDVRPADGVRVVQLTPPGSACSIGLGTGLAAYEAAPGSVRGLHLHRGRLLIRPAG